MRRIPLLLGLLVCLQPTTALAVFVPSGLNPGDEYRIAFQTQNARDARSPLISTYNSFVQDQAAMSALTDGANVDYFAVGSTSLVNAIDNVGESSTPIYLLNDTLVVNNTDDLWNTLNVDLVNTISVNQYGEDEFLGAEIWTGSAPGGTAFMTNVLGSVSPRFGFNSLADASWIATGDGDADDNKPFYAISEVLIAPVPVPAAVWLFGSGLLGLIGVAKRRKAA